MASTLAEFMTGPREIHSNPNVEFFFISRYCSHESRSGLLASWAPTKKEFPITRDKNMPASKVLTFINSDLPQIDILKTQKSAVIPIF
jgi:hypothetical protein